ncbi:MAG: glycosyltransferase family 39 protein [Candidatus Rokubacteria bacterium]|nr:glycosyltransferase family 39 protein [Candidatus Rokubacteria bacterium]
MSPDDVRARPPAAQRGSRLTTRSTAARTLLALLLAAGAVLTFARLDDRYLWEDEAENALLSHNVIDVGLPVARHGGHVISQGCGFDADENYLWTFHAWLPMYLTAASFKAFGVSTFTARLPFALAGFLMIPTLYLVGRRLFRDGRIALLACVFLTLSVPFLLHARQSRYYAIAALAGVWMLHFFVGTVEGRRWAPVGLVAASTVMVHANHPMFPATFLALLVAFAVVGLERRALGRLLGAAAAVLVVNAPLLAIYGTGWVVAFGAPSSAPTWATVQAALDVFLIYLRRIDFVALPVTLLLAFTVWLIREGREAVWGSADFRRCIFLLVFVAAYVATLAPLPTVFLRYVVHLLPALALVQAYVLVTVGVRRPIVATVAAIVLLTSDVAHGWLSGVAHRLEPAQPAVRWPLAWYVYEITHDFEGPIEAIVGHLRAHARPGDRVYISYGDGPIRFYTGLEVRGGQACQSPVVFPPPEWVIIRSFFRSTNTAPGYAEDVQRHIRYVREEIPWRLYQRIELPVVDTVWENIPEPQWHHFWAPASGSRVVLHRRVAGPGIDPQTGR